MFYHPDNERGVSRARREMRAKAICSSCPVRAMCLASALKTREPYGVWGGLSVEEREQRLLRLGATA
jgi:WhiB family transcriptional regulator, redox-sensing transcriptional regulator